MNKVGWLVVFAAIYAASPGYAQSITGGSSGVVAGSSGVVVVTRQIGGARIKQAYLTTVRSHDAKTRSRRKSGAVRRCRTGLFGRVVNAPCRSRVRRGGISNGRPY